MKKSAIVLALGMLLLLTACGNQADKAESPSPSQEAVTSSEAPSEANGMTDAVSPAPTEPIEESASPAQDSATVDAVDYSEGVYKVGSDIPAGVYFVAANEGSVLSSLTVRDGSSSDSKVLAVSPFTRTAIIQVSDGEYLDVTSAIFTDISNTQDIYGLSAQNGVYLDGGYLVGFHLPAGEYKVEPDEDAILSSYTIYSDGMRTVKDVQIVSGSGYVTLQDGEFLNLSGASITPSN